MMAKKQLSSEQIELLKELERQIDRVADACNLSHGIAILGKWAFMPRQEAEVMALMAAAAGMVGQIDEETPHRTETLQ